jgi:hypothetical protein
MSFAVPILPRSTVSGNQWRQNRIIEESGQTFLVGTPVQVNSSDGGLQAWDGTTTTAGIAGISYEAASNLGSTGSGAPVPLSPFTGVGAVAGTFGSVPNESSAKNIAHGAPLNDGRCGLNINDLDTVFSAAFGTTGAATTPLVTDVGISYGMTKETASGYWYVDKAKTGGSAVVRVIALDPRVVAAAGTQVFFVFLQGSEQLSA